MMLSDAQTAGKFKLWAESALGIATKRKPRKEATTRSTLPSPAVSSSHRKFPRRSSERAPPQRAFAQ